MKRVVIVGGGLAGLATAFFLRQARPDLQVTVLEKDPEAGGKVRSSLTHGYTVDWAANGFLPNVPDTLELVQELGLTGELLEADPVAKERYLYKNGALHKLPASPPAFLRSSLLLPSEKLRAAAEPLSGRAYSGEESVYSFVARHFGRGVAEVFAGPFVLGITAGDAKELSLDALFPRLRALEQQHGSLVRGLVAQQRAAKDADPDTLKRLTSFQGGSGRLVEALQERLGENVRCSAEVTRLQPTASGFRVYGGSLVLEADAAVLAVPSFVAADLTRPFALPAAALCEIPYADVHVFGLGYSRIDVPNALGGFGFLVPRGEGVRVLGVLYSSSIFPGQAPAGRVLLRVIAGGSVDPAFAALSQAEMVAAVRRDLRVTLGIVAEPEFAEHRPWPGGIPQYRLGHAARVERAEAALAAHPGLFLTGNAYRGVGVNDTVRDARNTAQKVLAALTRQPGVN